MPYRGNIAYIPLGREGLNYSKNPNFISRSGLLQSEGIAYTDDSLRKEPGRVKLGHYSGLSDDPSIFSLFDWLPNEGTQFLVSLATSGLLYIAPAGNPVLNQNETATGISTMPTRAKFVTCGGESNGRDRALALFTGVGPVGLYIGTSTGAVKKTVTAPSDWTGGDQPLNGCPHNGRLFAIGNQNAPHSLYGSTIDDHADFRDGVETGVSTASSATYHRCHPGVGLRLYTLHSHKSFLFLMKYPVGIFWLDDSDVDPEGWKVNQITDATGVAPTPHASVLLDDGILFMSPNGQFFLLTVSTQGGIVLTDLSTRMNIDTWLARNINLTRLSQVVSCWNPTTKEALFAVPSKRDGSSSTTNDLLLSFDFRAFTKGDATVRFSYSYRDGLQSLTIRRNPTSYLYEVMSSDYEGNAWQHNQEDRSINSELPGETPSLAGYQSIFQISHTNLSEYMEDNELGSMNKNFQWLGIEYVPNTGGSIEVIEYVDGVAQPTQTLSLKQSGPVIASSPGETEFTIWSGSGSTTASELAGSTTSGLDLRIKWVRLTGTGRRISIEIKSSSVASEDMHITGLYIGFERAGQDVGRGQGAS